MGAIGCRGGAAPVRGRRVSPRVEGPGDEPPAVEAAHKGAHERLKSLLTIVPVVIVVLLLLGLVVAVILSQST